MNKLKKLKKAVIEIINYPALLNIILNRNEAQKVQFNKKYGHHNPLLQIPFLDLVECPIHASPITFLGGGSMLTDLSLLGALCQKFKNCNYFEVGTWRGESAANVAKFCENVTSIYLPDEQMKTMGLKKSYIQAHGQLCKDLSNVQLIQADSMNFDYTSLNQKYDVIFIDGNHHYPYVKHDTEQVFKHLLHRDSIVVWHDYAYSPEDVRYEVYKGILDGTTSKIHSKIYHIANTKCAVYLPNYSGIAKQFTDIVGPEVLFEVSLKKLNTDNKALK